MRWWLRAWHLALGASAALAVAASTAQEGQPPDGPPAGGEWLAFYADLVEETELRRRVNVLHPNPQSILAGASKMTVSVAALVNGQSLTASQSGYEIHGQNPTQAQIFSIATRLEHKAVAWQESSHRQFKAARHVGIGLPLLGSPDGWGLMQLELSNPVEGWGEHELWDWRENMSEGVQYLAGRYAEAEAYFSENYRLAATNNDDEDDWPFNPADDPKNLWDDAFSRYNTGRSIYSPDGNKGERNCKKYPGRCAYAAAIRKHMREKPWE